MNEDAKEFTEEQLLYSNNLVRKSFQWELWQSCNNFCKFCCFGEAIKHTSKQRQLQSLAQLKEALETLNYEEYNGISLFGGEFFQGQLADSDVRAAFFEVIRIICNLYVSKKIGYVWLTANLLIGQQADLYETLNIFDEAGVRPVANYDPSGLWICTSWDVEGRFLTCARKQNWEHHMAKIHQLYPWVKLNTCVVLSQPFCELYLEGGFSPSQFMAKYNTSLAYNSPRIFRLNDEDAGLEQGSLLESLAKRKEDIESWMGFRFYPLRRTMRKFLVKYAKDDANTFNKLFDVGLTADEFHRNFNTSEGSELHTADKLREREACDTIDSALNPLCSCGHTVRYATYSDCNECMLCDRNQVWSSSRHFV